MIFDVATNIGKYEVYSHAVFLISLPICYKLRPTKMLMSSRIGKFVYFNCEKKMPKLIGFIQTKSEKFTTWLSNNKIFKKIPETLQLKTKTFSKSITESFVIYWISKPVVAYCVFKKFPYQ